MSVLEEGVTEVGVSGRASAFAGGPAIVRTCYPVIDFFPGALSDIVNEHAASARLKAKGIWIAQTKGPYRSISARGCIKKRIVRWNTAIGVIAKDFTKAIAECLGISRVSILTYARVKLTIRTEVEPPAVMVRRAT